MKKLDQLPFSSKIKASIQALITGASSMLEKNTQLMPVVFLISETEIIPIMTSDMDNEEKKELFANFARQKADEIKAEFTLFITEGYALTTQNPDYSKSISSHPDSEEIVLFMIESLTNTWMGRGKIINANDGRKLGPISFSETAEIGGRFANLLPKLKTQ